MAERSSARKTQWSPRTVGAVIGGAFGVSLLLLLGMRATWVLLLIGFSPIISLLPIAALFALAIGVGAALGTALARAEGVPSLPAVSTLLLALMVAIGPVVAGMIEVGLRSAPFPLPADVRTVTWDKDPMGGQTLRLESALSVPDLNDRLVEAAKNSGWVCRYCQY